MIDELIMNDFFFFVMDVFFDGKYIVIGDMKNWVCVWDLWIGELVEMGWEFNFFVYFVRFLFDGLELVIGMGNGVVWIWDCEMGVDVGYLLFYDGDVFIIYFYLMKWCLLMMISNMVVCLWNLLGDFLDCNFLEFMDDWDFNVGKCWLSFDGIELVIGFFNGGV